jgi:hypothetical protein
MALSKFITIIFSLYTLYYLVIILLDQLKQNKLPDAATGKQHIDLSGFQGPQQAKIETVTDATTEDEKKNSISQPLYQAAPDKIPQEAMNNNVLHDLGLETVEIDGIEVNDRNIMELIYNTVQ